MGNVISDDGKPPAGAWPISTLFRQWPRHSSRVGTGGLKRSEEEGTTSFLFFSWKYYFGIIQRKCCYFSLKLLLSSCRAVWKYLRDVSVHFFDFVSCLGAHRGGASKLLEGSSFFRLYFIALNTREAGRENISSN